MRKLGLVLVSCIMLVALLVPMGSAQTGAVRLAITREEGTLNPYTYQSGYPGWNLMTLVYDTLYYPDPDNVPQPWMVRDTKVSADGKTWTLTLRNGLRWHDGEPLTAEDVKFTIEYVRKYAHSRWTSQTRDIESVETQGPRVVVFNLRIPSAGFRSQPLADLPILPKHIWESVTEPRRFNSTIGSGPYRVEEVRAGQFYRLVANAGYFAGRPRVPELILPIIRDATVSFTALQAGEIDANVRGLLPELVAQFEKSPGVKVVRGPGFASTLLQFNLEHPQLKDVRLRRAIANAINASLMVRLLMLGYAVVGSPGYIHPSFPLANPDMKFQPNKSKAVAILNEAGYKDRDGDGVREAPDGTPLRFTLLAQAESPIRIRGAELIRTWLKDIGIAVQVRVMDDASVIDLVWPDFDVCKGRRFDMSMFGWSAPVMTRTTALRDLFHSDCRLGTVNIGGYKNPKMDALGNDLAVTVDPATQKAIVFQMQRLIAEDVPVHTLFYPDGIYAYQEARYGGWVYQSGTGIVNKLSFVNAPK